MDHDFYSLEEAAKELSCDINNLLKMGADGKIEVCIWYQGMDYWANSLCPLSSVTEFITISKEDIMLAYQENKVASPPQKHTQITLKYKNHPPMLINGSFSLAVNDLYLLKQTFQTLKTERQIESPAQVVSQTTTRSKKTKPDGTLTEAVKKLFQHFLEKGESETLKKENICYFANNMKKLIGESHSRTDKKDMEISKYLSERIKSVAFNGKSFTIKTMDYNHPRKNGTIKPEKSNSYKKEDIEKRLKPLREKYSILD